MPITIGRHSIAPGSAINLPTADSSQESVAYRPGVLKQHNDSTWGNVKLDQPLAHAKNKISEAVSKLDQDTLMLLLIWQANKDAKQMYMTMKSNEMLSSIEAKKAQVEDMYSSGKYMIVGAVLSGAAGLGGFAAGGAGFASTQRGISQEKLLKTGIAGAEDNLKMLGDVKPPAVKAKSPAEGGIDNELTSLSNRHSLDESIYYDALDSSFSARLNDSAEGDLFTTLERNTFEGKLSTSSQNVADTVDGGIKPKTGDITDSEFFEQFDLGRVEDRKRLEGVIKQANDDLGTLSERLKSRDRIVELVKAFSGTANGLFTSSFQAKQTFIQGDGKELDIQAGIHDGFKQKAAEMIKALEDSQKEMTQLLKEIAESVNQAMRAAGGVA